MKCRTACGSQWLQERFLYWVIMHCRHFYVSSHSDCTEQNFPCFSSVFFLEVLGGKGDLFKKNRNTPDWSNVTITLAVLWTKRHFARRPNVYDQVMICPTSLAQQTRHMPNVMPTFSVKQCIGPTLTQT